MAGQVVEAGPRPTVTGTIRIRLRAPARRRNLELLLLIGALVLSGAAVVLVQLGALGRVGNTLLALEAGLAVLVIAGHA
ncbi:MAG: cell division protein FtsW, partial [Pseudolysinimonas sp.]